MTDRPTNRPTDRPTEQNLIVSAMTANRKKNSEKVLRNNTKHKRVSKKKSSQKIKYFNSKEQKATDIIHMNLIYFFLVEKKIKN